MVCGLWWGGPSALIDNHRGYAVTQRYMAKTSPELSQYILADLFTEFKRLSLIGILEISIITST